MLRKVIRRVLEPVLGREKVNLLAQRNQTRLARRRTKERLESLPARDLRVNLGCGQRPLPGWLNVDLPHMAGADIAWDLRRPLPFREGSCSAIFAEHIIEHLSKADGEKLLKECYRALQPGGVLRLSTPDAGRYLRAYAEDGEFLRHPNFQTPMETPLDRINVMMREDGQHLWVYDAASLMLALRQVGFSEVVEQGYGVSLHPGMTDVDAEGRAFESLYVEGVK